MDVREPPGGSLLTQGGSWTDSYMATASPSDETAGSADEAWRNKLKKQNLEETDHEQN